jgi:hypothetical protein
MTLGRTAVAGSGREMAGGLVATAVLGAATLVALAGLVTKAFVTTTALVWGGVGAKLVTTWVETMAG